MNHAPAPFGRDVVAYTALDDRHASTGATRHFLGGQLAPRPKGLLICRNEAEGGFFLFGCDQDWNPITDTWHATLDGAMAQAEFEHRGTMGTWIKPSQTTD